MTLQFDMIPEQDRVAALRQAVAARELAKRLLSYATKAKMIYEKQKGLDWRVSKADGKEYLNKIKQLIHAAESCDRFAETLETLNGKGARFFVSPFAPKRGKNLK